MNVGSKNKSLDFRNSNPCDEETPIFFLIIWLPVITVDKTKIEQKNMANKTDHRETQRHTHSHSYIIFRFLCSLAKILYGFVFIRISNNIFTLWFCFWNLIFVISFDINGAFLSIICQMECSNTINIIWIIIGSLKTQDWMENFFSKKTKKKINIKSICEHVYYVYN